MLKSLDRLKNMVGRPAHTYRPTTETFPDLDTQRLAADLELVQKGKMRGESEQPTSESAAFDQVENDILEQIGAAQKRAHDALENHLTGFRQRLVDLDFETQFSNIRSASLGGLSDLKQELQTGIDDLHGLRRDLSAAESWHVSFTKRHRLDRPSSISTPRGTFFKIAVLVLLVLAEFVTNGALLSNSSEMGLVGGILQAIIFSILNVGVALFFGIVLIPFVNHRNLILKLIGAIAFVGWLALAVGINLGLAHYREIAEVDPERVGIAVMDRLWSAPFALADFESWLLFALGFLFSAIAMIDGLSMRDNYPGFAKVDKAVRTARDKYADKRRDSIEQLGFVRKEYEDLLAEARADLGKQRGEHDSIVSHRARLISLFDEHQAQLEKACNMLLRSYRDANIAARSTPAPPRFEQRYELPRISVSIAKEGEWNSSELRASIASAQAEIDQIFVALGKAFDEALARYKELDSVTPEAS